MERAGRLASFAVHGSLIHSMTSYDRIRAALLHQDVDRIPFCPFLAYVWEHYPKEIQERGQLAFHHRIGADPLWRGTPCPAKTIDPPQCHTERREVGDQAHTCTTTPVGTLHFTHQRSPQGSTWFLTEHPLKSAEDFKVQLWIEQHTRLEWDDAPVQQHFSGEGREGLSLGVLIPRYKTAFQILVEHYVGTEELTYALADCPEAVEELLAAMIENDRKAAEMSAAGPYEFFLTWEDSSTQNYSPQQYRKYIQPEITAWCQILRQHGKHYLQHACGHVRDLLPMMVEQGNLGVESISPCPTGNISIGDARAKLPPGFAIIGGIEPTHFLRLEARALDHHIEQALAAGTQGAFVLANSDSCPPGVTEAKFAQAAHLAQTWRK